MALVGVGTLYPAEARLPARAVTANATLIAVSVWYSDSDVRIYWGLPVPVPATLS
jgi:hypothetical protein